jgi:hypothetical protein
VGTRILQVCCLVLGGLGAFGAISVALETSRCTGELCGLGYVVAVVVAVPAGLALLGGGLSLALRRHRTASFVLALLGALGALLPGLLVLLSA